MNRGQIIQGIVGIVVVIGVLFALWDTASEPIQIDPQRLLFGQIIAYGTVGILALIGIFFDGKRTKRE